MIEQNIERFGKICLIGVVSENNTETTTANVVKADKIKTSKATAYLKMANMPLNETPSNEVSDLCDGMRCGIRASTIDTWGQIDEISTGKRSKWCDKTWYDRKWCVVVKHGEHDWETSRDCDKTRLKKHESLPVCQVPDWFDSSRARECDQVDTRRCGRWLHAAARRTKKPALAVRLG